MLRRILCGLAIFIFFVGVPFMARAEEDREVSASSAAKAEDVGNKICPVMGGRVAENPKITYEYKGKIYNFGCEGCVEEFKKDPDKYIKKVEEELQARAKTLGDQQEATSSQNKR